MATEIRFAFALNGGVSLAIWIGGAVDEVLRFVDAGRQLDVDEAATDHTNPWVALCREVKVRPTVDVLTGSSAGGLNAAFLAAAVLHGCTNLHPIRQLWIDHGAFDTLLRSPTDLVLSSVLNGDENFLPHIEEAFSLLEKAGDGFRDVDPPVNVRLTATSLGGQVTRISGGHGEIYALDHRAEFIFGNHDFDFGNDDKAIPRLARACRSTASFPGAFEPSLVPAGLYEERHVSGLFQDRTAESAFVVDGGVLVNLPAVAAIESIIRQPSRERIERVLALVVPDPGQPPVGTEEAPTLNEVLSKSIVGIPRTQSLTDFGRELNEHNLEVRSRRAGREALLSEFAGQTPHDAWTQFAAVANGLFPAYRSSRAMSSIDGIRVSFPWGHPELKLPETGAWDAPDVHAEPLPWVPRAMAVGGSDWCWGSAPVRRLAAMLITWINTVAATAEAEEAARLYAIKDAAGRVRAIAERISPPHGTFEGLLAEEMAHVVPLAEAIARARQRWPGEDREARVAALNEQLTALGACLTDFVTHARPLGGPSLVLAGLVNLYDGAIAAAGDVTPLLLCTEVIEASFAGSEPRPDQEIRLVQFTSNGAVALDELARSTPDDKLAGVELAHFGAFLKRSWRANDWMWGRLDAAERLVGLVDSVLGDPMARAGTLLGHARAVQAEIVRQELPVVVREISEDERRGANIGAEAKALRAAVESAAGAVGDDGLADLSSLTERQLQELLTIDLVGSENLQVEAGSNLVTMTSISALAVASAVLRSQGPRLLRTPIGLVGASSTLAWRVTRRTQGRQFRWLEAIVVGWALFGLAGTIIDLTTTVDLGPIRYIAWAALVIAPMLFVVAAPWLLVSGAKRLTGRRPRAT